MQKDLCKNCFFWDRDHGDCLFLAMQPKGEHPLKKRCRLLGLYERKGRWYGVLVCIKEAADRRCQSKEEYSCYFRHLFTADDITRIFAPLGGIGAVRDMFYESYFGLEVIL